MKNLVLLIASAVLVCLAEQSSAQDHSHHPKHNMVLFGTSEIYASHIVYKVPHNYQVILEVKFDSSVQQEYLRAKAEHSSSLFIFLLDSMDIGKIETANSVSGTIQYEDSEGERHLVVEKVSLSKENFKVIYFNELPLSLANTSVHLQQVKKKENCMHIKCY
jgi:hypothetical protein